MLYIARDDGTGTFFPKRAFGHLFLVVNTDGGIGETDNPADPKGLQVTYRRTDPGIPAVRIDTLANELAPTNSNLDIVIFPVAGNFVLPGGSVITSSAGAALPVGDVDNPTAADIATIYDTSQCNGSGYWVDKEGGGTTTNPPEVMLYHELSHCFRFIANTAAVGTAAEEIAAETDENDFRAQQGLPHRNIQSHNGGCGGGPTQCCIIVSIAGGSAFGPEVNRLRCVRDYLVRHTRVGDRFVDRLLYQYYSFSPEVCRAMANAPDLRDQIRDRWVVPLIFALELAVFAGESDFDPNAIGRKLDEQLADTRLGGQVDVGSVAALVDLASTMLSADTAPPAMLPRSAADLVPHLRNQLVDAGHVQWALVRTLGIWSQAAVRRFNGETAYEVGRTLRRDLEMWLADAPVDDIWNDFGAAEAEIELDSLGLSIFRTLAARDGFAKRITAQAPRLAPVLANWVVHGDGAAKESYAMTKAPRGPTKKTKKPQQPPRTKPARLPLNLAIEPSGSSVEGDWILLRYVLGNSSERTLHAYARVRRIQMDQTTGLLKLALDDSHIDPNSVLDTHLQSPPLLAIGGGDTAKLELQVPRRISKLPKAAPGEAPKVQIEDLEGFRHIDLRIAYSDTPFYYKPGSESIGAQLRAWTKDIAELSHTAEQIGWRVEPTAR